PLKGKECKGCPCLFWEQVTSLPAAYGPAAKKNPRPSSGIFFKFYSVLLQPKGNRDTERNPYCPPPLFPGSHFGQSADNPFGFRLQALVRSPHSYIPDTTVLLDYEHYIDPSLYSHFLGEFRITEVLADVLLHHIVKTIPQFCFGLIF